MEHNRDTARVRLLTEVREHISAWNTLSFAQRTRLLRTAIPAEASVFVSHSNSLECVPTLSAADTYEMVQKSSTYKMVQQTATYEMMQQTAAMPPNSAALRATMNTYDAFRLARAFRQERGASGIDAAEEFLWHVPQVLAVHRTLISSLHHRPGRLRISDSKQ